jgi:hypothetical protein
MRHRPSIADDPGLVTRGQRRPGGGPSPAMSPAMGRRQHQFCPNPRTRISSEGRSSRIRAAPDAAPAARRPSCHEAPHGDPMGKQPGVRYRTRPAIGRGASPGEASAPRDQRCGTARRQPPTQDSCSARADPEAGRPSSGRHRRAPSPRRSAMDPRSRGWAVSSKPGRRRFKSCLRTRTAGSGCRHPARHPPHADERAPRGDDGL